MVIGILQCELLIHDSESLKDKRRVVRSLKDRLHREHLAAVAEVGEPDVLNRAVLGIAVVGREGRQVGEVLDRISAKLRSCVDAEVGGMAREILHGQEPVAPDEPGDESPDTPSCSTEEMLRYFDTGERPDPRNHS